MKLLTILCGPISPRCTASHISKLPSSLATSLECYRHSNAWIRAEIGLKLTIALTPDLLTSDNPLPVRSLSMLVHTLGDRVGTQLLQKCSASLREFHLFLQESTVPSLPFLPYLCGLSLHAEYECDVPVLTSWFPFFYRHRSITRLCLTVNLPW